jgi:hypothetical protein
MGIVLACDWSCVLLWSCLILFSATLLVVFSNASKGQALFGSNAMGSPKFGGKYTMWVW